MNKKAIIIILLALVAMTGQAQVKCHVEGILETDAWGDEIIICEVGTDLRVVDEPRFHVKAKDRHFTYDIETDFPRLYKVFFFLFSARFCPKKVICLKMRHIQFSDWAFWDTSFRCEG